MWLKKFGELLKKHKLFEVVQPSLVELLLTKILMVERGERID